MALVVGQVSGHTLRAHVDGFQVQFAHRNTVNPGVLRSINPRLNEWHRAHTALLDKYAAHNCLPLVRLLCFHLDRSNNLSMEDKRKIVRRCASRCVSVSFGVLHVAPDVLAWLLQHYRTFDLVSELPDHLLGCVMTTGDCHMALVRQLTLSGADSNARIGGDIPVLLRALAYGQVETAQCLVENGADPTAVNEAGIGAIEALLYPLYLYDLSHHPRFLNLARLMILSGAVPCCLSDDVQDMARLQLPRGMSLRDRHLIVRLCVRYVRSVQRIVDRCVPQGFRDLLPIVTSYLSRVRASVHYEESELDRQEAQVLGSGWGLLPRVHRHLRSMALQSTTRRRALVSRWRKARQTYTGERPMRGKRRKKDRRRSTQWRRYNHQRRGAQMRRRS